MSGAGAGLRHMPHCQWWPALGGRPRVEADVVPLPSRSSSPTVTGCRLGGYPGVSNGGSDWWGGERDVGGVLPHINIGADVWGELSIMTGVC